MQKRSHKLLARTLLDGCAGFSKKRFELAFVFGSFQPDCNPLSYLKGSLRAKKLMGHNYSNSQRYIDAHIDRLQRRNRWTIWQYYTLGKLTHYLADAFTFPHNDTYPDSLVAHRHYEDALRCDLAAYLKNRSPVRERPQQNAAAAIDNLHRLYLDVASDRQRDIFYILEANSLLMASVLPAGA
ncbi:MAG: zinc dependent phospholipase C family protein [Oscillibacter sp.]|nr:zinc dependent phospholipase C family protein [Oscillibacter sp.]